MTKQKTLHESSGGGGDFSLKDFEERLRRIEVGVNYAVAYRSEMFLGKTEPTRHSGNMLVLEKTAAGGDRLIRERGVCTLDYELREGEVDINFVQKVPGADIPKAEADLGGVNPFEFLVARFIAKIAPLLDAFPETEVRFDPLMQYREKSPKVFWKLRDLFFEEDENGNWTLNPRRKRVQDMLGKDSRWIKVRTQTPEAGGGGGYTRWQL